MTDDLTKLMGLYEWAQRHAFFDIREMAKARIEELMAEDLPMKAHDVDTSAGLSAVWRTRIADHSTIERAIVDGVPLSPPTTEAEMSMDRTVQAIRAHINAELQRVDPAYRD
jgi:hypothetical protein